MHWVRGLAAIVLVAWTVSAPQARGAGAVRLASNEWAPYAGPELPDQGMATTVIRAALARMGYDLSVDFVPWRRALMLGLTGSQGHDGVFAVYVERTGPGSGCLASAPIGISPLGFAERRSDPVAWTRVADLAGRRIGVISEYFNSREFDELAGRGVLTVDPADREMLNLRRLAQGRLDLSVIDAHVFAFLVKDVPELRAGLRMNRRLLEEKPYFVCFRAAAGERAIRLRDDFNAGLSSLDVRRIQEDYLRAVAGSDR